MKKFINVKRIFEELAENDFDLNVETYIDNKLIYIDYIKCSYIKYLDCMAYKMRRKNTNSRFTITSININECIPLNKEWMKEINKSYNEMLSCKDKEVKIKVDVIVDKKINYSFWL